MEDLAHEGCSTGTAIVVLHAISHTLHGLAHVKIPVPLSSLQSLFIVAVIFLAPIHCSRFVLDTVRSYW
jgi:hypothetical protein